MSDVRETVNYVAPEALADALRRARAAGALTDEVSELAGQIARRSMSLGVGQGFDRHQRDEVLSEVYWTLARRWRRIDPERNPFAFITGAVRYAVLRVAGDAHGGDGRKEAAAREWEEERRSRSSLAAVVDASVEFGPQGW
ncbi:MAG: hypothetical protein WC992_05160 [Acholeplasmataceae bacterium]|jgi:hypothetical protein